MQGIVVYNHTIEEWFTLHPACKQEANLESFVFL